MYAFGPVIDTSPVGKEEKDKNRKNMKELCHRCHV
jgi:hypothetical protein